MGLAATEREALVAVAKLVVPAGICAAITCGLVAAIFVWHRFLLVRGILNRDPELTQFLRWFLSLLSIGALIGVGVRFEGVFFVDAFAGAVFSFPACVFLALLLCDY